MGESLSRQCGAAPRGAAGCLLSLSIAAAPWMYGSTRHWAIVILCSMLSATTVLWILGCSLVKKCPGFPPALIYPVLFLLSSGWLVTLTGPILPFDPFTREHFANLVHQSPGSLVLKSPVETMWLFSGLLGALLVTVDLSSSRLWWMAIYKTMAVTGVSIVILGFTQILTGAKTALWEADVPGTGTFFGTFFHHSIAGAYINLIWPLAAGLWICALENKDQRTLLRIGTMTIWGLAVVVGLCGPLAQVSRFAQVNAALLAAIFAVWWVRRRKEPRSATSFVQIAVGVVSLAAVISAAAIWFGRLPEIKGRWGLLPPPGSVASSQIVGDFRMRPDLFIVATQATGFFGARETCARICLRMIPDAGLLGFGPGSWTSAYPHYTDDPMIRTFFLHVQFAHLDWLQTVVEWGILGAAAWGTLIVGGGRRALRWLSRPKIMRPGVETDQRDPLVAGLVISLGGLLLHALIDFPLQIPSIQLYFVVLLGLVWTSAPLATGDNGRGHVLGR